MDTTVYDIQSNVRYYSLNVLLQIVFCVVIDPESIVYGPLSIRQDKVLPRPKVQSTEPITGSNPSNGVVVVPEERSTGPSLTLQGRPPSSLI